MNAKIVKTCTDIKVACICGTLPIHYSDLTPPHPLLHEWLEYFPLSGTCTCLRIQVLSVGVVVMILKSMFLIQNRPFVQVQRFLHGNTRRLYPAPRIVLASSRLYTRR